MRAGLTWFAPATALALLASACSETHVVLPGVGDGSAGPAASLRVSAGAYHTCAIADGALYCWGLNANGQLGTGTNDNEPRPARVGTATDWVAVAAAETSTVGLKRDGTLWSWGSNEVGQLGLGDFSARRRPVQIASARSWITIAGHFKHFCAIDQSRWLWCWGGNDEGELGQADPGAGSDRATPVRVGTADDWLIVSPGQGHTCGIRAAGALYCWGRNSRSELGQGDSAPAQIRAPALVEPEGGWQDVQAGQNTTCALRSDAVTCWGLSNGGSIPQTDVDEVVPVPAPVSVPLPDPIVEVAVNTFHGCARAQSGAVACWGRNEEGQIGLGDFGSVAEPQELALAGWSQISTGRFSSCGVRAGTVHCTGDNRHGQLGQGDAGTSARRASHVPVPLPR